MHDLMSHQIKDGVGNAKIVQHIDPVENKEEDSFQKKEIRLWIVLVCHHNQFLNLTTLRIIEAYKG